MSVAAGPELMSTAASLAIEARMAGERTLSTTATAILIQRHHAGNGVMLEVCAAHDLIRPTVSTEKKRVRGRHRVGRAASRRARRLGLGPA